jgi:hypothetical protein
LPKSMNVDAAFCTCPTSRDGGNCRRIYMRAANQVQSPIDK